MHSILISKNKFIVQILAEWIFSDCKFIVTDKRTKLLNINTKNYIDNDLIFVYLNLQLWDEALAPQ